MYKEFETGKSKINENIESFTYFYVVKDFKDCKGLYLAVDEEICVRLINDKTNTVVGITNHDLFLENQIRMITYSDLLENCVLKTQEVYEEWKRRGNPKVHPHHVRLHCFCKKCVELRKGQRK